MRPAVRALVFGLFTVVASAACTAPDAEEDAAEDLASALADDSDQRPFQDAYFIPSSDLAIGTWTAYTVARTAGEPTEMVFVNHALSKTSIAIAVDVAKDTFRVVSAPADGSGEAALDALVHDLARFDDGSADASASPGGIEPQGVLDGVATNTTKRILLKASKKLRANSNILYTKIRNYTSFSYVPLNGFLRSGNVPLFWSRHRITREARTITHALSVLDPIAIESRRWNQVGFRTDTPTLDREALSKFVAQLRPGTTYRDGAFFSTTANDVPPKDLFAFTTFRFDVMGRTGRDVSGISNFPEEKEILFLPQTAFRVVSLRGEWIPKLSTLDPGKKFPEASEWRAFVRTLADLFPQMTDEAIDAHLRAGRTPTVVVRLDEVP